MYDEQVRRQYKKVAYSGKLKLDFSPFETQLDQLSAGRIGELDRLLLEADIPSIQRQCQRGTLDARQLALYYLWRIRRYDVDRLNAVIELNPEALEIANALDAERRAGKLRGPLHGIPLLIKANIATGDRMHTTAGAKAMESARADRDSFIVRRLREAGAVPLGKANLSEWANFMTHFSANGFSVLGGQARNPYGKFDVSGSSSGSAAAVAANLIPAAIGTETCGSLIAPASANSIVSLKPSLGLVSRDRIIPISSEMDTAGPMARTMADVCLLMNAIEGPDPEDPATLNARTIFNGDCSQFLERDGLKGMRVGFVTQHKVAEADRAIVQSALDGLRSCGADVIELRIQQPFTWDDFIEVLCYGMKHDLNRYLASVQGYASMHSLAEVIQFNQQDLPNRAPFGQDQLERSQANLQTPQEHAALSGRIKSAAAAALRRLRSEGRADLLLSLGPSLSLYYAPAGFPALTIPGGYRKRGEPVGLTFVGDHLQDSRLVTAAYALEQMLNARKTPIL